MVITHVVAHTARSGQAASDRRGVSVAHTADRRVIAAALDAFFIQRIHRWSSHDVQRQFVLRTNREMYRHLIAGSSDDALRLTTLRVGAQCVAYALSVFTTGGQLWCV